MNDELSIEGESDVLRSKWVSHAGALSFPYELTTQVNGALTAPVA